MQSKDEDIFRKIAAKWNHIKEINVTETIRNQTKQICYGIIYGMGVKSLAESLKVEEPVAMQLSEDFHKTYPGIKKYTDRIVAEARKNQYIETITGRRRYFPAIISEKPSEKSSYAISIKN